MTGLLTKQGPVNNVTSHKPMQSVPTRVACNPNRVALFDTRVLLASPAVTRLSAYPRRTFGHGGEGGLAICQVTTSALRTLVYEPGCSSLDRQS